MENIKEENLNPNTPINLADLPKEKTEDLKLFKFSKIQIIIISVCALLFLILLIVVLFKKATTTQVPVIKPSPIVTEQQSMQPREVSEFGKTESFVNFEAKLLNLQKLNETVDLSESKLTFPLLDMQVNFD